jgi:hypothetical protein
LGAAAAGGAGGSCASILAIEPLSIGSDNGGRLKSSASIELIFG